MIPGPNLVQHPGRCPASPAGRLPSLWRRLRTTVRVVREQPDWAAFAGSGWPDRIMAEAVTDRFHAKQGRSIGRWTLEASGRTLTVYLKRHYKLPFWPGVWATLFPGRAWSPGLEEWDHLEWVRSQGIPAPRAVAAGQFVGPGCRLQGFLAVEELTDMLPIHQAVPLAHATLPADQFLTWKRGLTAEMARLAREFHRRNAFHKDLYFCHFYIPEALCREVPDGWANRVFVIDLHRLGRHRLGAAWFLVKDLAQLLYSSAVAGVTARDRVRFWKLYRRGWPGRPPGAWLRGLIRLKWKLYRRHNARRPSLPPARSDA